MSQYSSNNKRLAKNTIVLYARMFLTVGVSFYISRVVLKNLGVSDFGLYNLIGGFVTMFYIVTASLSVAITRFLTCELGAGDRERQIRTLSTSVNIELLFSLIVVLVGETVGLWFVNTQLVIESGSMWVANIVYQLSILSFVVELVGVPYYSLVIAHEKMGLFAYNTIINVLLKLVIALLLVVSPINRLLFYTLGVTAVGVLTQMIYYFYSRVKFEECRYVLCFDKGLFHSMFSFGGWNLLTSASSMLKGQGLNILLNMFFGTVVNAAYGIARQLESTVRAFSKNFLLAIYPQITKSYSEGDLHRAQFLTYRGTKYSFLLLFVIGFPIILIADTFLDVWLVEVPQYSVAFVRLTIVLSLLEMLLSSVNYINQATGNIKMYQIVSSAAQFMVLPISYFMLKFGCNPTLTLFVGIVTEAVTIPYRVIINKKDAGITWEDYRTEVLNRLLPVVLISSVLCIPLNFALPHNLICGSVVVALSLLSVGLTSYFFAFDEPEKNLVKRVYVSVKSKLFHK